MMKQLTETFKVLYKKHTKGFVAAIILLLLCMAGACSPDAPDSNPQQASSTSISASASSNASIAEEPENDGEADGQEDPSSAAEDNGAAPASASAASSNGSSSEKQKASSKQSANKESSKGVPSELGKGWEAQSGGLYYTNNADPDFATYKGNKGKSFEDYADLDSMGRCGPAMACIGLDIMPTGGRGDISEVKPTGWMQSSYDFVNGGYLYNRCHLIAYSLAGENANRNNLITGTRQMNEAMIMFESIVSTYVTGTGNHVLYRVTPVFSGSELLARGVHMEALSVEDKGKRVKFNVYIPNKQDGVKIDYSTGKNSLAKGEGSSSSKSKAESSTSSKSTSSSKASKPKGGSSAKSKESASSKGTEASYILNTSSKKFHYATCSAVSRMNEGNKGYTSSRDEAISGGYSPCGICHP